MQKMAMAMVMEDNDEFTALLENKDVYCFSSHLGHFPDIIRDAKFIKYLGIDVVTVTGVKFYGVEAHWQNMMLYFFVGEDLAPTRSNKI